MEKIYLSILLAAAIIFFTVQWINAQIKSKKRVDCAQNEIRRTRINAEIYLRFIGLDHENVTKICQLAEEIILTMAARSNGCVTVEDDEQLVMGIDNNRFYVCDMRKELFQKELNSCFDMSEIVVAIADFYGFIDKKTPA